METNNIDNKHMQKNVFEKKKMTLKVPHFCACLAKTSIVYPTQFFDRDLLHSFLQVQGGLFFPKKS